MNKIYVVGIGPGAEAYLTAQARAALEDAQVICGYTLYLDLVAPFCQGKETFSTPMRGEMDRCRACLDFARQGKTTVLVCSGDAGVYGMASPLLELAADLVEEAPEIQVVPGITAALSGGAILGSPLSHDFCVISLSDLLTPWSVIEKRLQAAALGDFSIALYNPSSKKRADYLRRACTILQEAGKTPDTVCGWVRNIGRAEESHGLCTLAELTETAVDMFTTVFIGSSATRVLKGRMVTPRGYRP